jgi:cytochrome c-type biogenesis protein CcmF
MHHLVGNLLGQFIFLGLAFLLLAFCFINDDFSVRYVASNSSIQLPFAYKLTALWGGHEGSILLWAMILSTWMLMVSIFRGPLSDDMLARILVILGFVSLGFLLFLIMTSNPFVRIFDDSLSNGRDLNPLLQDPGFLFHPPMLYMGYVGFSIAFAFALAALWAGRVESSWAAWTRPWTLAAWCCLTAGITLGSWWAYRELGWGGWWFWDPVENASFMPWLVGTALIHSLIVTQKRGALKAWTVLLAITSFALSLVGTFLVRSGVLTSVHAFAVDPTRGLFMLIFLLCVVGVSLLMFATRGHLLYSAKNFSIASRESFLILNNIILTVLMLTVLLGTLYPLLIDGLGLGKLSVGAPYFNSVFVPLAIPLLFVLGLGPHMKWQRGGAMPAPFVKLAVFSLLCAFMITFYYARGLNLFATLGIFIAVWIIATSVYWLIQAKSLTLAMWGMLLAHVGVACVVLGITISSNFGLEKALRLSPGDKLSIAGVSLRFKSINELKGPNYHGVEALFSLKTALGEKLIKPQKRIYEIGQMAMTDSAIDVTPVRDIYLALGEPIGESAWGVRVYYKPFVRFIWGGGFLILAGGMCALVQRRYRIKAIHNEVVHA